MGKKLTLARVLICVVLFFNLQSAAVFIARPAAYIDGFGLEGLAGAQMVRGMGVLFVMWNVPYIFALLNPAWNRISLIEAIVMQAIGLAGETLILLLGGPNSGQITATIKRFIVFDGVGLLLLVTAAVLTRNFKPGD